MPRLEPDPYSGAQRLVARTFDSGFPEAHDSYNSMGTGSDGRIYYVLSSESLDRGAQMFAFDPATERIEHLGDLTEACGEKGLRAVPQNKSHVNFVEANGRLYFATHIGIYGTVDGQDVMVTPPTGYGPYPGGHFLACDMRSKTFEAFARDPGGGGIIASTMDPERGRLYGLTWPAAHFLSYDLARRELRDLGPIPGHEGGSLQRGICRAPVVVPTDGSVLFTTTDGSILRYDFERQAIALLVAARTDLQ